LALKVVSRLCENSGLCPELRELEVAVTVMYWEYIFGLVAEMVEARTRGGTGRRMRRVECLPNLGPEQEREMMREMWDRFWRDLGLDKYLDDE
jgi:hypothetical protein